MAIASLMQLCHQRITSIERRAFLNPSACRKKRPSRREFRAVFSRVALVESPALLNWRRAGQPPPLFERTFKITLNCDLVRKLFPFGQHTLNRTAMFSTHFLPEIHPLRDRLDLLWVEIQFSPAIRPISSPRSSRSICKLRPRSAKSFELASNSAIISSRPTIDIS